MISSSSVVDEFFFFENLCDFEGCFDFLDGFSGGARRRWRVLSGGLRRR